MSFFLNQGIFKEFFSNLKILPTSLEIVLEACFVGNETLPNLKLMKPIRKMPSCPFSQFRENPEIYLYNCKKRFSVVFCERQHFLLQPVHCLCDGKLNIRPIWHVNAFVDPKSDYPRMQLQGTFNSVKNKGNLIFFVFNTQKIVI